MLGLPFAGGRGREEVQPARSGLRLASLRLQAPSPVPVSRDWVWTQGAFALRLCHGNKTLSCCRAEAGRMPLKSKGKGRKGVKPQEQSAAAPWRDVAWQVSADSKGLKLRLQDLEKALEQAREDKRDMHEAMARQYRELQEQTASRSCSLEAEVKSLREQLAAKLQESRQAQETAARALAEKDVTIAQLQGRLDAMEMEYEKILHGSLDLVLAKLAGASQRWKEIGTTISLEHKERLKEFGLNPLEI
ncbi:coiled-coil domain-containing protein 153 [Rhea pennata]|uniref:coiled-coil domain-containing protein 153 n=1 Tax=Rhea pennata TaxID=8795 RepID=UPI002E25D7B8